MASTAPAPAAPTTAPSEEVGPSPRSYFEAATGEESTTGEIDERATLRAPDDFTEIPLMLQTDVGVTLSTPWQEDSAMDSGEAMPYTITGPPEVVAFLEARAAAAGGGHGALDGFLSPPAPVTIQSRKARKEAGIPLECATFCFVYPHPSLDGLFVRLMEEGRSDPWLFFLLLGGFCYFDATRKLVRANALTVSGDAKAKLVMQGPHTPAREAMEVLRQAKRLRPVTLHALRESGLVFFAWVNPAERPGGHALLADGSDGAGGGCFVYESSDGTGVLYDLVSSDVAGFKGSAQLRTSRPMPKSATWDAATAANMRHSEKPRRRASVLSRESADRRLRGAMTSIAKVTMISIQLREKLIADLKVWRRTSVEKWLRHHGLLMISYYALGTVRRRPTPETRSRARAPGRHERASTDPAPPLSAPAPLAPLPVPSDLPDRIASPPSPHSPRQLAYFFFEGWHPLDSVYYLTATATTNGDEIVPVTTGGKFFSTFYILLGITVVFQGLYPIADYCLQHIQRQISHFTERLADRTTAMLHGVDDCAQRLEESAQQCAPAPIARILRAPIHLVRSSIAEAIGTAAVAQSSVARQLSPAGLTRQLSSRPTLQGHPSDRVSARQVSSKELLALSGAPPNAGGPPGLARQSSAQATSTLADAAQNKARAVSEVRAQAMEDAIRDIVDTVALMLVVGLIGIMIATLVHGYDLVTAAYWTIGCMTTAGGDLQADSSLLQVLYIFYMPLGAVTMLTAARQIVTSTARRKVRLDQYELKLHDLLQQEARERDDASCRMREADFVIAVLKANDMIDLQTVNAIKVQFSMMRDLKREGDDEIYVDSEVVFRHLIRQQRVMDRSLKAGAAATHDRDAVSYVDTSKKDGGYAEWFGTHWEAGLANADSAAPPEAAAAAVDDAEVDAADATPRDATPPGAGPLLAAAKPLPPAARPGASDGGYTLLVDEEEVGRLAGAPLPVEGAAEYQA